MNGEVGLKVKSSEIGSFIEALKRFEEAAEKIAERGHDARLFINHFYKYVGDPEDTPSWELGIDVGEPAIIQVKEKGETKAEIADGFEVYAYTRRDEVKFRYDTLADFSFESVVPPGVPASIRYVARINADRNIVELEHVKKEKAKD